MHNFLTPDVGWKMRAIVCTFFGRMCFNECPGGGGGGTLGISGWGCAAGTLEPLAYTRARSAEFCYPILE